MRYLQVHYSMNKLVEITVYVYIYTHLESMYNYLSNDVVCYIFQKV